MDYEGFTPLDVSRFIDDEQDAEFLLKDAIESGDYKYITNAMAIVAKAHNMTKLAKVAGVSRATLYNIFEGNNIPSAETFLNLLNALGVKISLKEFNAQNL
jgi:probable addiction module antidote protein